MLGRRAGHACHMANIESQDLKAGMDMRPGRSNVPPETVGLAGCCNWGFGKHHLRLHVPLVQELPLVDCWTLTCRAHVKPLGDTRSLHPPPCAFGLGLGLAGAPVQHVTKGVIIGEHGRTAISMVQRQELDG